ncbi:hypothetical protein EAO75_43980 [Streptomyces sp. uw30]|uniref:hypothetical protein n=1 Tax=Streptomyces sp. uw30 TaxID=1828179 RepID=UPI0011CD7BEF|nr:hypothetical protein [Streptomyces sp. uw30]TXS35578.1 hypothetical protein EAO75_43980 [Streptomyces sp. uw30]
MAVPEERFPLLGHRPDNPRYDLDLASYAVTKPIRNDPDDPNSDWHWEPKEAYRALKHRYAHHP